MKISIRGKDVRICELIRRYDLDPIEAESGSEVLHFRYVINVYRVLDGGLFFPRVFRYEFFRLQVSDFKEAVCEESSDEELLVEDTSQTWEDMIEPTESVVLKRVLRKIEETFERKSGSD